MKQRKSVKNLGEPTCQMTTVIKIPVYLLGEKKKIQQENNAKAEQYSLIHNSENNDLNLYTCTYTDAYIHTHSKESKYKIQKKKSECDFFFGILFSHFREKFFFILLHE